MVPYSTLLFDLMKFINQHKDVVISVYTNNQHNHQQQRQLNSLTDHTNTNTDTAVSIDDVNLELENSSADVNTGKTEDKIIECNEVSHTHDVVTTINMTTNSIQLSTEAKKLLKLLPASHTQWNKLFLTIAKYLISMTNGLYADLNYSLLENVFSSSVPLTSSQSNLTESNGINTNNNNISKNNYYSFYKEPDATSEKFVATHCSNPKCRKELFEIYFTCRKCGILCLKCSTLTCLTIHYAKNNKHTNALKSMMAGRHKKLSVNSFFNIDSNNNNALDGKSVTSSTEITIQSVALKDNNINNINNNNNSNSSSLSNSNDNNNDAIIDASGANNNIARPKRNTMTTNNSINSNSNNTTSSITKQDENVLNLITNIQDCSAVYDSSAVNTERNMNESSDSHTETSLVSTEQFHILYPIPNTKGYMTSTDDVSLSHAKKSHLAVESTYGNYMEDNNNHMDPIETKHPIDSYYIYRTHPRKMVSELKEFIDTYLSSRDIKNNEDIQLFLNSSKSLIGLQEKSK